MDVWAVAKGYDSVEDPDREHGMGMKGIIIIGKG